MTLKNTIEDISSSYARTRLKNKRILQEREQMIYEKIPRIKEIETSSALSYLQAARARLKDDTTSREVISEIKRSNRRLTEEKRQLLKDNGYSADFLDPIYDCSKCHDTGYINDTKCTCFLRKVANSLYLQSNLGKILLRENFDTFSLHYYSDEIPEDKGISPYENITNVLEHAKQFAMDFEKRESERGNVLIYGETGLGKTFISNCIAKELLDNNHTVLYLSANELFEKVLGGYIMNHRIELEPLYSYIFSCELLIIDDLGTELTNSFVQTQFFEIINQRNLTGLSTLISTNLSIRDLRDRYTERVMSRIVANYTVFNIYGDNIRYQKRRNAINQTS